MDKKSTVILDENGNIVNNKEVIDSETAPTVETAPSVGWHDWTNQSNNNSGE